jgi:hypothetical protein
MQVEGGGEGTPTFAGSFLFFEEAFFGRWRYWPRSVLRELTLAFVASFF